MIILIVDLRAWNPHNSFSYPDPKHLMNSDPDPGLFNHQIDFKTSFKSKKKTYNF